MNVDLVLHTFVIFESSAVIGSLANVTLLHPTTILSDVKRIRKTRPVTAIEASMLVAIRRAYGFEYVIKDTSGHSVYPLAQTFSSAKASYTNGTA